MRMSTKRNCLLGLALLFSLALFSQSKERRILDIPPRYFKPYEGMNVSKSQESTDFPWMVYSDRPLNKTYTNQNGLTGFKTIDFLDKFFVIEEKDEWIHIFKEPEGTEITNTLSKEAIDFGWVNKDLVLLWRRCLYTERDVSKKAMILNTEAAVKSAIKKGEGTLVKFYKDPQLSVLTDKQSNIFSIFFIYKFYPDNKNPSSVLLGYREFIEQGVASDDIWGWVDYKRITAWDHRVAILPKTTPEAVSERKRAGIKSTVMMDVPSSSKFSDNKKVSDEMVIWNSDNYRNSFPGTYMRFPVLWDIKKINENKGNMKVGVMGEILGEEKNMDQFTYAGVQRNINVNRLNSRNINLVFVIDGTTSMGPYFVKIAEAIVQVMKQLEENNSRNTFRFGAVIYRDKDEESRLTEICPITSTANEIATKLRKVEAKDLRDKDTEEAVFYGIKTAIRALNVPSDQTNYLILIGDAGNHTRDDDTQVPMEEVVDLLSKFNYNFLAFQVHNPGGNNAYSTFIRQNRDILIKASDIAYVKVKNIAEKAGGKVPAPPTQRLDGDVRKFVMDNPTTFGSVSYVLPGMVVAPETLKKEIIAAVSAANDTTNIILEAVNSAAMEGKSIQTAIDDANKKVKTTTPSSEKVDFFASGVWLQLAKSNIPPENLKILMDEHYQMYFPGYTNLKRVNLSNELWQYDLFYTSDEFFEVKKGFEKLIEAKSSNDRRKFFKEAWKQLLVKSLGEKNMEDMESKTIEEIEKLVFGLPGTSEFLQLKLSDLDDPAKLPNEKLVQWQVRIENKLKQLNRIWNNVGDAHKEYTFNSNDNLYFWVPQTLLP